MSKTTKPVQLVLLVGDIIRRLDKRHCSVKVGVVFTIKI